MRATVSEAMRQLAEVLELHGNIEVAWEIAAAGGPTLPRAIRPEPGPCGLEPRQEARRPVPPVPPDAATVLCCDLCEGEIRAPAGLPPGTKFGCPRCGLEYTWLPQRPAAHALYDPNLELSRQPQDWWDETPR